MDPGQDFDDAESPRSTPSFLINQQVVVPVDVESINSLNELEPSSDIIWISEGFQERPPSHENLADDSNEADRNRNVVDCSSDIYVDVTATLPHCNVQPSTLLASLIQEDTQIQFLTSRIQEYQVYSEKQGQERPTKVTTTAPVSEQTSVYFDAVESQSGRSDTVDNRSKTVKRRRRRGTKWCCCCQKKGGDESGDGYEDDKSSADYLTARTGTVNKSTSDTSTRRTRTPAVSSKAVNVTSREFEPPRRPNQQRRKRVPDRPDKNMSLWGVLKNAMSKDISRSPLPVHFSEPLSMLQRLAEDYEYSNLLDKAAKLDDQWEQLCYVAAFSVASYGNTAIRTYKPFNPLLGETYEMDRMSDLGWSYISEQVSHHPATAATYCEGAAGWVAWSDFTMHSKWHMNTCDFDPSGVAHVKFNRTGHHYSWSKVTTVVHNLIWGKLWVDQVGDMTVTNHTTGDTCKLKFVPTGGRSDKVVNGTVVTKLGEVKWTLSGNWDKQFVATPSGKTSGGAVVLWRINSPPADAEKYYHFTEFACQLNELEAGVAPTDSRLRPDQRLMEQGLWDEANLDKSRLEDRQRKRIQKFEPDDNQKTSQSTISLTTPRRQYVPLWFRKVKNEITSKTEYKYNNLYWERKITANWTVCPTIFEIF